MDVQHADPAAAEFGDGAPPLASGRGGPGRFRLRRTGWFGVITLLVVFAACVGSLPWTTATVGDESSSEATASRRYEASDLERILLPPSWATHRADERTRLGDDAPANLLGTDRLGRDLLTRCLVGGAISLGIGFAAAAISVLIGTLYGSLAGYAGGGVDAAMMRVVDILYGLPYILLVVLLAVAVDGLVSRYAGDVAPGSRQVINVVTLLVAIGSVSWLTMARVVRGQVLSLKERPFMESARAIGVPVRVQFVRHLLPNLLGPIVVYATLTVPQAILQESFLSFLGIGVQPPLPSWGNLAAEGLSELNPVRARWWLLLWPCVLLAVTLLSLNFVGESFREAFDPRRRRDR